MEREKILERILEKMDIKPFENPKKTRLQNLLSTIDNMFIGFDLEEHNEMFDTEERELLSNLYNSWLFSMSNP